MAAGKALRAKVPRTSHAEWKAPPNRRDPVDVLAQSDRGRLPKLLPIRYGRMRQSPFAFFRGSAALMAMDLAGTPVTRIHVQACGDCHAANFGGFASPERRLLFDINDFDETLRAPWEWDVKRLAASVSLASRELELGAQRCSEAVEVMAASYRKRMRDYADMRALDVWYSHLDAEVFVEEAKSESASAAWAPGATSCSSLPAKTIRCSCSARKRCRRCWSRTPARAATGTRASASSLGSACCSRRATSFSGGRAIPTGGTTTSGSCAT
jgi:hypothetical protein